jgi:hypothetical protein
MSSQTKPYRAAGIFYTTYQNEPSQPFCLELRRGQAAEDLAEFYRKSCQDPEDPDAFQPGVLSAEEYYGDVAMRGPDDEESEILFVTFADEDRVEALAELDLPAEES